MQGRLDRLMEAQRRFFRSGSTRGGEFRAEQLNRLRAAIQRYESEILAAVQQDLGKPKKEAYGSEIAFLYTELDHTLERLQGWMKPRRVATPSALQPATSYLVHEPLGQVLIIAPWNYPFQLVIGPLIGAIAAGNGARRRGQRWGRDGAGIAAAALGPHLLHRLHRRRPDRGRSGGPAPDPCHPGTRREEPLHRRPGG